MKLAILYAGQGSQHPGMGKDLYEAYPAFRAAFDAAALDFDLHSVCFEDPDGVLNQTEQPEKSCGTFPAVLTFCGLWTADVLIHWGIYYFRAGQSPP